MNGRKGVDAKAGAFRLTKSTRQCEFSLNYWAKSVISGPPCCLLVLEHWCIAHYFVAPENSEFSESVNVDAADTFAA